MHAADRRGGDVVVDVDRVVAMLALTAIHDIMKVEALLPPLIHSNSL